MGQKDTLCELTTERVEVKEEEKDPPVESEAVSEGVVVTLGVGHLELWEEGVGYTEREGVKETVIEEEREVVTVLDPEIKGVQDTVKED